MDLNYLFSRHQLSLMRAGASTSREVRRAHVGLATGYAGRIRDIQTAVGAGFPMTPECRI